MWVISGTMVTAPQGGECARGCWLLSPGTPWTGLLGPPANAAPPSGPTPDLEAASLSGGRGHFQGAMGGLQGKTL